MKHQDHFRCIITCGYCGKRRYYEDECHIKRRESEEHKKAEEQRRKKAGKGGKPEGGGLTQEVLMVRVTLLEEEGPQPPQLAEEEHATPHVRMSSRVKNGLCPPPQVLVAPTRAARTRRSAVTTGNLSACRLLGLR